MNHPTGLGAVGRRPLSYDGGGTLATSPPYAVTGGAARPGSARRSVVWQPAAVVAVAVAAVLPFRPADKPSADGDTSPRLTDPTREAAATTSVAWASGGAAPVARPSFGAHRACL